MSNFPATGVGVCSARNDVGQKTLIFIPTYNERDNAPRMCQEIHDLGLDADVLFLDDDSPDGTGKALEVMKLRFPRLIVQHRVGKLGIGSAHAEAIQWAYAQGYELLITMDCDFTHAPADVPALIEKSRDCDVVVGSRWAKKHSLPGWNCFRRGMTWLGHFLTRCVLGIPQDASGAFRAYRLDRLPREVFHLVEARGYSFFFESLFILNRNSFAIREVPIVLPARTYGHSKMTAAGAASSARRVFELFLTSARTPEKFLLPGAMPQIEPRHADPQNWEEYWNAQASKSGMAYELVAGLYRRHVIKRNLNKAIREAFVIGSKLLHAGCGSGQVDADLQHRMQITALDVSPAALSRYCRNVPKAKAVIHGSIFNLPFPSGTLDGVYNLGVMEHFTHEEVVRIFKEFHRVLTPKGKLVMFWPHRWATSVLVLRLIHRLLNRDPKMPTLLHPPEPSLLEGKKEAAALLAEAGFCLESYKFGIRDFFVQAVVMGRKRL